MKLYSVHVEYIVERLGSGSANPEIYSEYIASKASDAASRKEEVDAIGAEAVEEKGMTVFSHLPDGTPFTWDYQWKGFFKEACKFCKKADDGKESKKIKAYKQDIDGLVFVNPRKIPLVVPDDSQPGKCQRPLRASTAQGERIALANSETVSEGTTQDFQVELLKGDMFGALLEWLDYGKRKGTGQWRNSGKGRFLFRLKDEQTGKVYSNFPQR